MNNTAASCRPHFTRRLPAMFRMANPTTTLMAESDMEKVLRSAIQVLPAFALALGSLSTHAQSAGPQGGGPVALPAGMGFNVDSYHDARYCAGVGRAFKDEVMEKRWTVIADAIGKAPGLAPGELDDVDYEIETSGPAYWIIGDPAWLGTSQTEQKYRDHYNQCRARLRSMGTQPPTAPAQLAGPSNAYLNPYAPPRFTAAERKVMIRTGDANTFKALLNKDHTWSAYCLVSIDALYRLSEQNPSALGLDPVNTADKQLLESIAERRARAFSVFQLTFKKDQESLAREYVQKQLVNYNKGMDQHRSSTAEIGLYVKAQSTECDAAFGGWQGLTRGKTGSEHSFR